MTRYVSAEKMTSDDFGDRFTFKEGEVVYDAMTRGPSRVWATMTQKSYNMNGNGQLGLGKGQKYVRNAAGELHKVQG